MAKRKQIARRRKIGMILSSVEDSLTAQELADKLQERSPRLDTSSQRSISNLMRGSKGIRSDFIRKTGMKVALRTYEMIDYEAYMNWVERGE
jgi:hypothetical protein|tara:strand:+ start:1043 stop:1318 length:276 start_codon:yes stop_codon:yes gene_type:complete